MPGQVEVVGSDGRPVQNLPPVTRVNLDDASGGEAEPASTGAPRAVTPPTQETAAASTPTRGRRGRPAGSRNKSRSSANLTPPSVETTDAPAPGRLTVECRFAFTQPGAATLIFNRKEIVTVASLEQLPAVYAKLMSDWAVDIARQVQETTAT